MILLPKIITNVNTISCPIIFSSVCKHFLKCWIIVFLKFGNVIVISVEFIIDEQQRSDTSASLTYILKGN